MIQFFGPFLFEILSHLGFGPIWCNLISNLLRSASTRIVVNGEPREEIRHKRGLHQGDPLSPMLFILVMDVLNYLFKKASELGLLQPLTPCHCEQRVSLYADDVTLFIKPNPPEMDLALSILTTFGEAFGLQTNLQKSCVIPIRCEQSQLDMVETSLSCAKGEFPCTYLGLPVSNKKLRKADLLAWVEKVGDRLPNWRASLMNMVRQVAWTRFILLPVPIHVLIAIKAPKWFIKAIKKHRRAFICTGREKANGGS